MGWRYDAASKQYRHDDGRVLTAADQRQLRDDLSAASKRWAESLVGLLAARVLSVEQFEIELRDRQARTYLAQHLLGGGGARQRVTTSAGALDRLGERLAAQAQYARKFAEDLADGEMSAAQAAARASLYFASSTQAFEQAVSLIWGIALPAFPGDGGTECGANCRCYWEIRDNLDGTIAAFWHTNAVEDCPGCIERERLYSPVVLELIKGDE